MNSNQIALIGIRVVAIYLVAQGISTLPNVYLFFAMYDSENLYQSAISVSVLAAIFLPIIVGCVVWSYAPEMITHLISSEETKENNTPLNINQFQSTVVVLIGLYLLVSNIPHAIASIYQLVNSTEEINGNSTLNLSIFSTAIAVNLKVLFGILLLVGSNVIVRALAKIRAIGTN